MTGLQVSHTLPNQSSFDGGLNQGGTHSNGTITWTGLTLDPLSSVALTFRVAIAADTLSPGDMLVNSTTAATNEGVTLPNTTFNTLVDPQVVYLPATLRGSGGGLSDPTCTPDPPGDSEDVADALTICAGRAVAGQLNGFDFANVYKISLTGNQLMTIDLVGNGAGDVDLYLYRPGISSISEDFSTESAVTNSNRERLETTTRYGGDWYVVVRKFSSANDMTYTLTVTVTPPKK